jgi:hypothetical protein
VLGAMVVKANRIATIVNSRPLRRIHISDADMLHRLVVIVSIQLGLLIWNTVTSYPYSRTSDGSGATYGYIVNECTNNSVSMAVQTAYLGGGTVWLAVQSFRSRKAPAEYNESGQVAAATLVAATVFVTLVPLDFGLRGDVNSSAIVRGLGTSLVTFSVCAALFFLKFLYIYEGKQDDERLCEHRKFGGLSKAIGGARATILKSLVRSPTTQVKTVNEYQLVGADIVKRRSLVLVDRETKERVVLSEEDVTIAGLEGEMQSSEPPEAPWERRVSIGRQQDVEVAAEMAGRGSSIKPDKDAHANHALVCI